jgi:hypothetical protein
MSPIAQILAKLEETLPPVFTRDVVERQTGGLLRKRHLANLDAAGEGPNGRIRLGKRTVGYEKESFLQWFAARLTAVHGKGGAS